MRRSCYDNLRYRKHKMWKSGLVEWIEDETAYISVVFSWQKQEAYQKCVWYKSLGYKVMVGGPAVSYDPTFFDDVAEVGDFYRDAIKLHNPQATFTSRGCIRNCSFCIVPSIEGNLYELENWPIRPIICDNNLLATSFNHFDSVIDKLKPLKGIDFNQGLDARLLTIHHADRLRELDTKCIRLAWDHSRLEKQFMKAFEILTASGFSTWHIRVYVLIGYNDDPEDARYRLETIKGLKAWPNPMRYQPIDSLQKNSYVNGKWTDQELKNYMRYWSRQNWLWKVPFEEYLG